MITHDDHVKELLDRYRPVIGPYLKIKTLPNLSRAQLQELNQAYIFLKPENGPVCLTCRDSLFHMVSYLMSWHDARLSLNETKIAVKMSFPKEEKPKKKVRAKKPRPEELN